MIGLVIVVVGAVWTCEKCKLCSNAINERGLQWNQTTKGDVCWCAFFFTSRSNPVKFFCVVSAKIVGKVNYYTLQK